MLNDCSWLRLFLLPKEKFGKEHDYSTSCTDHATLLILANKNIGTVTIDDGLYRSGNRLLGKKGKYIAN